MGLAWLAVLMLRRARSRPLQTDFDAVCLWIALFGLGDFAIQFCRADAAPAWLGWRAPQWADLALFGLATLLGILLALSRRKPAATSPA